ncbi:MAG: penicillin-binding protein activator [Sphingomonadales bacterium]
MSVLPMANHRNPAVALAVLLAFLLAACSETTTRVPVRASGAEAVRTSVPLNRRPVRRRFPATPPSKSLRFEQDEIRVAVLLPLTGGSAFVGQALLDAASMALFDALDPRIRVLPFDTLGTPEGAVLAAGEALKVRPQIVIGPLFAETIRAAGPIISARGLKLIGFSNDVSVASRRNLLLSFLPEDEVRRVVEFAAREGATRFAGLIPDSAYGAKVLSSLADSVIRARGTVTSIERYEDDAQKAAGPVRRLANYDVRSRAYKREKAFLKSLNDDLADEILKSIAHLETLESPGFDAVLVPEGGEMLRSLAPMLSFYEVDPKEVHYLGTGLWDDEELILEPSLEGAWFAGAPLESSRAFRSRFEALFDYQPPRIASLGYDAMSLVTILARREMRDERFSDKALFHPNGFRGVDGVFRFRQNGTAERRLAVIEIRADGFKTVSPAPKSFAGRR